MEFRLFVPYGDADKEFNTFTSESQQGTRQLPRGRRGQGRGRPGGAPPGGRCVMGAGRGWLETFLSPSPGGTCTSTSSSLSLPECPAQGVFLPPLSSTPETSRPLATSVASACFYHRTRKEVTWTPIVSRAPPPASSPANRSFKPLKSGRGGRC